MRRLAIAIVISAALFVPAATASAAADDPWVAYVVNSVVTRGGEPSAVVLRANFETGALEEISRNGPQGTLFEHPYDIAASPSGRSLYVADMGEFATGANPAADGRIIRVDPASGVQSLVSQGGELVDPAGIAVAPDGALFVVENVGAGPTRSPAVIRIDPRSGAQSVLTRGGNLCYPFGIAIEPSGNLIVTDFGDLVMESVTQIDCLQDFGSVVRVSPSGGQQLLSFNGMPDPGNVLRGTFGVAIEPSGGIVVVNQTGAQGALTVIDPSNGGQLPLATNASTSDAFELPQRVAVQPDGNLLVADFALNDQEGGLVRVERGTGAAQIVRQGMLFNNPLSVATLVSRRPEAVLNVRPRRVAGGDVVRYSAVGSSDPEGLPLRYAWDLDGNGSFEHASGSDPTVSRRFGRSTTLRPHVRVLDPHGIADEAGPRRRIIVDAIRPVIAGFRASTRRISSSAGPKKIRFRFRLSEPARVRIGIERALEGRRRGRRCVAAARARRSARRCTRWHEVIALRRHGRPGPNSITFAGRVRGRPLPAGRYRAQARATDRVGNDSRTPRAGFSAVPLL